MITEIHLIHHTHHDFGYTDAPETARRLQLEALASALVLAGQDNAYITSIADTRFADAGIVDTSIAEASAFRWTCEVFEPVEQLLAQRPDLAASLERLVTAGRVEVCAMPFNLTPLVGADGWGHILTRLKQLARFRPRVAMNSDVNGMPWGVLPGLRAAGVETIWMAMNTYSGGSPTPRPGAFWWEGPDGARMLVWNGLGYCDAYDFFHAEAWRRGPVPATHDVWFHAPGPQDIWDARPDGLQRAVQQLHKRLAGLDGYAFTALALQITNHWRIDNDPPCPHLADFVRAWNNAGLMPRIVFSTPSRFLTVLRPQLPTDLPVLRGDWCDWWADGAASTPVELVLQRRAKRLLADLPAAGQSLAGRFDTTALYDAWATASRFDEHTWGAYDSVARPWSGRALANQIGKSALAAQADETAACLRSELIRSSPLYAPVAHTRQLIVHNPGDVPRAGWVEIPAQAMRSPVAALCDPQGSLIPIETLTGAEWIEPDNGQRVDDLPDNVWPAVPWRCRFRSRLDAHELRRYEVLAEAGLPAVQAALPSGNAGPWHWQWDMAEARLLHLAHSHGPVLVDGSNTWRFGGLIIEQPTDPGARRALALRDPAVLADLVRQEPQALDWSAVPSPWGARFRCTYAHQAFRRIVQTWDFFTDGGLELMTVLHPLMTEEPQVWYLAFPLAFLAVASYQAIGVNTRVGLDQMPGSCGEVVVTDGLIHFHAAQTVVDIDADDTPLGVFGAPAARSGRCAGLLENSAWFAVLHHTYWATNFAVTRFGRLEVRHRLHLRRPDEPALSPGELWCFPVKC